MDANSKGLLRDGDCRTVFLRSHNPEVKGSNPFPATTNDPNPIKLSWSDLDR
jgi:hypothetical protein